MIDIQIRGDKKVKSQLRKLGKDFPRAAEIGLLNWMTSTMVLARSRTPRDTWGLYHSAYAYTRGGTGYMGFAASYAVYAHELSSQPFFMMSARMEMEPKLPAAVQRQVQHLLKGRPPHVNRSQNIARSFEEAKAKARDKNPRA